MSTLRIEKYQHGGPLHDYGVFDENNVELGSFGRIGVATLFAAAPDLLAACESMLRTCGSSADWNGETHESLLLIESAIAKAKGNQ